MVAERHYLLAPLVHRDYGIDIEQNRDLMRSSIRCFHAPGEIGNRPRQEIDIVHDRRGKKRECQRDAILAEFVARMRRSDRARSLLHCRNGIRTAAREPAHEAIRLAVDPRNTVDWLRAPSPMGSL